MSDLSNTVPVQRGEAALLRLAKAQQSILEEEDTAYSVGRRLLCS